MSVRTIPVGKYWLLAFLAFFRTFSLIAFIVLLVISVIHQSTYFLIIGGVVGALFLFSFLITLLENRNVICPLCRTPYFQNLQATRRSTRRFLGSKLLATARDIVFLRESVHCLHCGESVRWRGNR